MVLARVLVLALLSAHAAAIQDFDFSDLGKYVAPCPSFTCSAGEKPAPKKDFVFTANGCGTADLPISARAEFEECCNRHDACYSVCGMDKATCEKRLKKCMKAKCKAHWDPHQRDECQSTAQLLSIGANMITCPAYQDAQAEACECVPSHEFTDANRERLVHFLKENGAPEEDLWDDEIDSLLEKYKRDEPTMFLRLLKKYPDAVKIDAKKPGFMDDLAKQAGQGKASKDKSSKSSKAKRRKVEKDVPVDEHEDL